MKLLIAGEQYTTRIEMRVIDSFGPIQHLKLSSQIAPGAEISVLSVTGFPLKGANETKIGFVQAQTDSNSTPEFEIRAIRCENNEKCDFILPKRMTSPESPLYKVWLSNGNEW